MTIAVVQSKFLDFTADGAATTKVLAFDAPVTPGNCVQIFVVCAYGSTRGNFTLVGNLGGTVTNVPAAYVNGGFSNLYDLMGWVRANFPSADTSFTLTTDANAFNGVTAWLRELSGVDSSGTVVDAGGAAQTATGTGADAITTGSVLDQVAVGNNVAAYVVNQDTPSAMTVGAGFTSAGATTKDLGEFLVAVGTGTIAATAQHASVGDTLITGIVLKAAAGAPAIVNTGILARITRRVAG